MENLGVHSITIENKSRVIINSVLEVLAFSDKEIKLKLKNNDNLLVLGANLKITCFDNKNGSFIASGIVESVKYKNASDNLIKKVFK